MFTLSRGSRTRVVGSIERGGDVSAGVDLAPQRPRFVREKTELDGHILEPEWSGTRALVRVGHGEPRFVGYAGPVEGPRELYDAIVSDLQCGTAIVDGVLTDVEDERELEIDADGNAYVREPKPRTIF